MMSKSTLGVSGAQVKSRASTWCSFSVGWNRTWGRNIPFMSLQKRTLQERCEELVNLGTLDTLGHKNACTGKAELGCVWVELVVGPAAQRSAVTTEPRQRSERSGDTTRKPSLLTLGSNSLSKLGTRRIQQRSITLFLGAPSRGGRHVHDQVRNGDAVH